MGVDLFFIAEGKDEGGDGSHHGLGARRFNAQGFTQDGTPLEHQTPVALHDGRPAPFHEATHVVDGCRQGAVGAGISCAGPVELVTEARGAIKRDVGAMTDGQGMDGVLTVLPYMEKR